MKELTCLTENKHQYKIMIGNGLKEHLFEMDEIFGSYPQHLIIRISDKNVAKLYLSNVKSRSKSLGASVYTIDDSAKVENPKSLAQVEEIYYQLMDMGITRSDAIVALGGGVVGDLAGFCAATFMRGIDFVQIPTSLLAQVDSSVGGKVGSRSGLWQNLVGAPPAQDSSHRSAVSGYA